MAELTSFCMNYLAPSTKLLIIVWISRAICKYFSRSKYMPWRMEFQNQIVRIRVGAQGNENKVVSCWAS